MKYFGQRLLRHWNLKMLALGLSLLLYLAISGQPRSEVGLTAPIVFRNLPAGMEITNSHLHRVEVRLIGPADLVTRAAYTAISVSIDLSQATIGRHPVYLTQANVSTPFELHVASIRPNRLMLDLERVLTQRLQLRPEPIGTPAPGYHWQGARLYPAWVQATGPEPNLAKLHGRLPVALEVSGLRASRKIPFLLSSPDPSIRLTLPPGAYAEVEIGRLPGKPPAKLHSPSKTASAHPAERG